MDAIAKTSLLTAAMRAKETKLGEKENRLFIDPYAETLAGKEGFSILERAIAAAGDQPAVAIRTRFIDDKLTNALKKGVTQIVILAAGMDTRAYRLPIPKNISIFEIDKKEVLDYKNQKLHNVVPVCKRRTLPADLREEWPAQLLQIGFEKNQKTLWMVEGLLMYLQEPQALNIFKKISSLSSSQDVLLTDILSQDLLSAPHMKPQLQFLNSLGATWQFGTNEPEQWLSSLGWEATVIQTGEYVPSRWPFPITPRNIPHVPRGFLIEALKN
ncbi:SAM-dependent methyltransferase [bacterium]|nr:SAM-dependent methyltransferase [bacterium]